MGTPPTKFDWEYKAKGSGYQCHRDLTPLSFYENFVKPVFDVESKVRHDTVYCDCKECILKTDPVCFNNLFLL